MSTGLTLAEQIKQEQGKLDALRTDYFSRKDIEAIEAGNYSITPGGNVLLSGNAGSWAPGGHSHETKQKAAKIDARLKELKATQDAIKGGGRSLAGLQKAAGGIITPENYSAATVQYDENKTTAERDEKREFQKGLLSDERVEQERIRQAAALEAEKIRADNRLENTEARLFEQQMRNQDRALEREMRMFEMEEKGKGRKAELFKALFGLGTAFMI